ncbi:MAG TPA: hypothetical protein VF658_15695 [Pyrinomonadaceae bacterium]|jgi:sterol desaturase/sphingolipid hydroxylase (fatty acid hydroxylase superfamily)
MLELYFLFYKLPKAMSRLARQRKRSALKWSLAAIGAWIGTEFVILFCWSFLYEIGVIYWGWPEQEPRGLVFLVYVIALIAAMVSADIVRRVLYSMPAGDLLPPPPPEFD